MKMVDSDLEYALLLQNQLDVESKTGISDDSLLALKLQEDFNREFKCENPTGLSYDGKKKSKGDGRSLVDPSWELVDPTPNIHSLFMAFNERFFWNKLLAVCVSWSKRMTSCAGICSYQGRGGFCSVTLSEPLLKLRPRKDLVETLLHEMIHAFLFVTDNNRDRDGHGPEFHKHMYRINKEAGTNITVYHSFHDEVQLYKQHWWRCNGPCQNRKPYFGMVRRAMNRAPGPNDRWWAEHQQTCGGTFVKVREPEKQKSAPTSKATTTSSANGDIRKYIASPVKGTHPTSPKKSPNKTKAVVSPNHDIRSYFINNSSSTTNGEKKNVETNNLNNSDSPEIVAVLNTGNVHGFKGLGTSSKVRKDLKTTDFNKSYKGSVGIKSNNSNTVVVTSKQNTGSKITEKQSDNVVPFSGPGRVLSSSGNTLDHNKVRDHWLKKYGNSNLSTKRQASDGIQEAPNKKRHSSVIEIVDDKEEEDLVICPVCDKKIKINVSSEHIGQCLDRQFCDSEFEDLEETCYVCNKKVLKSAYKHHVAHCFNTSFGDGGLENLVECPICSMYFDKCKIEEHVIACIDAASEENRDKSDSNVLTQCTVCSEFVKSEKLALHQEQCLHRMLDDIEERYDIPTSNELISCLVCHKKVLKSELNAHLDECMSGVFEQKISRDTTKNDEETSCSKDHHSNENKYNCPFCMDLYSELDMSGHLDKCLKSSEQENNDRSILIDSFNSDDF